MFFINSSVNVTKYDNNVTITIALFILGLKVSSNNLQQFKYKIDRNNILQRY